MGSLVREHCKRMVGCLLFLFLGWGVHGMAGGWEKGEDRWGNNRPSPQLLYQVPAHNSFTRQPGLLTRQLRRARTSVHSGHPWAMGGGELKFLTPTIITRPGKRTP